MFKKLLIGTLTAVILVAAGTSVYTTLAAPASMSQTEPAAQEISIEPVSASPDTASTTETVILPAASSALTGDEIAGLLYMYEEEKLARDVYNTLYALYGQTIFQNIAASEQTHMDTVLSLMTRYGIAAPDTAAGVFNDPALQSLYNSLVASGSQSLADALKVGATIEEVDITDLQSRLAQTANADIQLIYSNLMNGSFNHLRNFVSVLQSQTGEVYQPQYLSADLYQTIATGTNGNGYGTSTGSSTTTTGHGRAAGAGTTSTSVNGRGYRGGR